MSREPNPHGTTNAALFTGGTEAPSLKKRSLRGRRLVVVDIENMAGAAVVTPEQSMCIHTALQESIDLHACEQVVIGTSHFGLLASWLGWKGPRYVVRSGKDGADLALLEVLTEERIVERFEEVVLASGDGIFTDVVAALGAAGVVVTIVARRGHCSRRLRMAASNSVFLEQQVEGIGGVA